MVEALPKKFTLNEYLELEKLTEQSYEFFNGEVIAMAGSSEAHDNVVTNLIAELKKCLREKGYQLFSGDMRVYNPLVESHTYPDVSICKLSPDKHKMSEGAEAVVDPIVLFEVTSPSTIERDRNLKYINFIALDSAQMYLLIDPDQIQVEVRVKNTQNEWVIKILSAEDLLEILGCSLKVKDLYV